MLRFPASTVGSVESLKLINAQSALQELDSAIQKIQQSGACSSACNGEIHHLTFDNPEVRHFCRVLDVIFSRGLLFPVDGYWACVRTLMPKTIADEIIAKWKPNSTKGRGLSWLYYCLNEGTLECYVQSLAQNEQALKSLYSPTAIVRDSKALNAIACLLRQLDTYKFHLSPEKPSQREQKEGCVNAANGSVGRDAPPAHIRTDVRVSTQRPRSISQCDPKLLETTVADFSDCARLIGIDVNGDQFLTRAELGQEATESVYTFSESLLSFKGPTTIVKKRRIPVSRPRTSAIRTQSTSSELGAFDMRGFQSPLLSSTPRLNVEEELFASYKRPDESSVKSESIMSERRSPDGEEQKPAQPSSEPVLVRPATTIQKVNSAPYLNASRSTAVPINVELAESLNNEENNNAMPETYKSVQFSLPATTDGSHNRIVSKHNEFEQQILKRLATLSSSRLNNSFVGSDSSSDFGAGDSLPKEITVSDVKPVRPRLLMHNNEISLESGEVVDLALNVFNHEGEQFYKVFMVYAGHHIGTPALRYLVLTNRAMYIARKTADDNGLASTYRAETSVAYEMIAYITLSLNAQSFSVYYKDKHGCYVVCTADRLLTESILASLELAIRRCDTKPALPSVVADASAQAECLQNWASAELHFEKTKCAVEHYSLVYWRNVECDAPSGQSPTRSGYLFHRVIDPSAWYFTSPEWQKSFFMLRSKKLYQFEDSTCKVGEKVYNLRHDVVGCRKVATKFQPHCIDVILPDDHCLQLACPTAHDMQQWLQALIFSLSQPDSDSAVTSAALACCCVLTRQHLLLCQENSAIGFVRTLAVASFNDIVNVSQCDEAFAVLLEVSSEVEYGGRWILSFACKNEYKTFVQTFSECWKAVFERDIDVQAELNMLTVQDCKAVHQQWYANF